MLTGMDEAAMTQSQTASGAYIVVDASNQPSSHGMHLGGGFLSQNMSVNSSRLVGPAREGRGSQMWKQEDGKSVNHHSGSHRVSQHAHQVLMVQSQNSSLDFSPSV